MSFRKIVRDVRDGFGSLSRRNFEVRLSNYNTGKSQAAVHELHDQEPVVQNNCWASLPTELLCDVIKRLEASESTWPSRKHVVACAGVCKAWREMCGDIVRNPEFCGNLTFPMSLKQPGPRDGTIQCFIKRDKSNLTYRLYLCLSPSVLVENGKFLLSAKRTHRTTSTEYIISMDANNISRSSNAYLGKLRSNFLGTKFIMYDTQPPYNASSISQPGKTSRRFYSKKISPKLPSCNYNIAQINYELNVLGTRGPRKMQCAMHSIPTSALNIDGTVPTLLDESFRSISFSKSSIIESSRDFSSSRFSEIAGESARMESFRFSEINGGARILADIEEEEGKERPLVLRNKAPRWHEQLQCWCLNFRGRVTVASVKNFQLIAGGPVPVQPGPPENDKIILQFGKVAKDMFTMDYRYPLSAFQAFAICLSSFDTKLACE